MSDWNCDGHYIAAETEEDARAEVRRLYGHDVHTIRPWSLFDEED